MAPGTRAAALAVIGLLLFPPWAALGAPTPLALSPVLERPSWAIGFFWTYHFDGSTNWEISGFRANHLNDTYTAEVVGEATTARGDAWIVRNAHTGSMSGTGPGGLPATASYTSVSFYTMRKSDLSILNFTQDINMTATVQFFGTYTGMGHNETYCEPPLAQIGYGTPADGTKWRVYSNLTSSSWFEIAGFPRVYTTGYLLLDLNESVVGTKGVTVPAGTFEAYNISGNGTADWNGTVYNYSETYLFAPRAMAKVVDEAGYGLISFFVNRPPELVAPLPVVRVASGSSNSSVDLDGYFDDPEGSAFTLSCLAPAGLTCSVALDGVLTVTADPGVNATLTVDIVADDGQPGGNASYPLTVLVQGPGNPNQPPSLVGSSTLTMSEDTTLAFVFADHFTDPDDVTLTYSYVPGPPLAAVSSSPTGLSLRPPLNFNGNSWLLVTAFDSAGNALDVNFTVIVTAVNDPPLIVPVSPLSLFVHVGANLSATVDATDPDGDTVTIHWDIDGAHAGATAPGAPLVVPAGGSSLLSPGNHTLNATANDGMGGTAVLRFSVRVFDGPRVDSFSPTSTALRIAAGSSIAFRVNASDVDSPSLFYTWTQDGVLIVASGFERSNLTINLNGSGMRTIAVTVEDNGTAVSVEWTVTVEAVPPGLVTLETPTEGQLFDGPLVVNASARVDPRLTNVTVRWTFNGIAISHFLTVQTPLLSSSGAYRFDLEVDGLYNDTVAYSARLSVNFTVRVPIQQPPNITNNTTGEQPGGSSLWIWVLIAVVVGAAVIAAVWARSRRAPPTPPSA